MKQVTYEDIRKELIEVGIRARANFGPNLDHIRSHARDRGVTLTWGQESDVLLSVQTLCRTRLSELSSDYTIGLPDVRKPPIDYLKPFRLRRRRKFRFTAVSDASRPYGDPDRRSRNDERQRQFRT